MITKKCGIAKTKAQMAQKSAKYGRELNAMKASVPMHARPGIKNTSISEQLNSIAIRPYRVGGTVLVSIVVRPAGILRVC